MEEEDSLEEPNGLALLEEVDTGLKMLRPENQPPPSRIDFSTLLRSMCM